VAGRAIRASAQPRTGDRTTQVTADNQKSMQTQLRNVPFMAGRAIPAISLVGSTAKTVKHALGRIPKGWIVTDRTVAADAVRRISWDKDDIVLSTATTQTLSIWIY
jgi:hypothetical protein